MEIAQRMVIELLREGQRVRFVARGGSMWPTVRDGTLVEVVPCGADALRPGELGAYVGTRGLVVHRVVAREAGGVRFRGDARPKDDGWIEASRVLGRVSVLAAPPWRLRVPTVRHVLFGLRALRSWLRRPREHT